MDAINHSESWVVYDIVLPTVYNLNEQNDAVKPLAGHEIWRYLILRHTHITARFIFAGLKGHRAFNFLEWTRYVMRIWNVSWSAPGKIWSSTFKLQNGTWLYPVFVATKYHKTTTSEARGLGWWVQRSLRQVCSGGPLLAQHGRHPSAAHREDWHGSCRALLWKPRKPGEWSSYTLW